jgi:hypothetical protein
MAIPSGPLTNYVTSGANFLTSEYYPTITSIDTTNGGSLEVLFQANPPSGAGWRLLGDTNAFLPSDFTINLLPGNYLIEFAPVAGFIQLPTASVQVSAGSAAVVQVIYQPSQTAPSSFLLPAPVPPGQISDLADYPFGYNGQLETDVGYGSGVAVETNVVLTAAHLVFNDQTLSYVGEAWWYPQEEAPQYVPQPQPAQGWLVLGGYASQRTADLQSGLYAADQSSPQSRNFDVAALYFSSPVAGGGYGGYLPSDATPNFWLTSSAEKMLVGYPVDGSIFDIAGITGGQMYQVGPQPYPLSLATDPVSDQQVYTADWFLGLPGNSGGPLYVQLNGVYYPAGVYLGSLFSGTIPIASAVRAIDSNVVNLITNAQAFVTTGKNNSGGGVVLINAGAGITSNPGAVEVTVAPPAAAQAGGAWKFSNLSDSEYSVDNPSALPVTSTDSEQLQFRQIPGWNLPGSQAVTVSPGKVTSLTGAYTLAVSWTTPPAITYGTPLGSTQLNALVPALTNGASGVFDYNPANGSVLTVGSQTLSVNFTPDDTINYGSASASAIVSLTVTPAPLTVTAADVVQTYGQASPLLTGTIAGLQNGDNITAIYNCAATTNSPVGSYAIVPTLVDPNGLEGNYTVTIVNGTLTVTTAVPVLTWAAPSAVTYGAALSSEQLNALANVPGSYSYTPANGLSPNAGVTALSVFFTPADALDYTAAADTVNLVVSPAPLTATAFNASCSYGAAIPVFTGSLAGLVNGDNIAVSYNCSATATSPAGTYPIVPSLVDPNNRQINYIVTLVSGTLTVTPPTSPATPPVIQSATQSSGSITFTWSAPANQNYQIQTTMDLTQSGWTTIANGTTGANPTMTTTEPIDTGGPQFFRVVLVP